MALVGTVPLVAEFRRRRNKHTKSCKFHRRKRKAAGAGSASYRAAARNGSIMKQSSFSKAEKASG
jgi:hypothetical protein